MNSVGEGGAYFFTLRQSEAGEVHTTVCLAHNVLHILPAQAHRFSSQLQWANLKY